MIQYLLAPLVAWFIAQFIKFSTQALRGEIDFSLFWRSGGMPSSHTSIVTTLLTVVLVLDGLASPLFGVVAVMTMIVIYDAVGVRRSVHQIIPVVAELAVKSDIEVDASLLRTRGHTAKEVTFGLLNGVVVGLIFTASKWASTLSFLSDTPQQSELLFFSLFFGLAFIAGISVFIFGYRAAAKKLPTYSKLKRMAFWSLITPTVLGALFIVGSRETMGPLAWRFWLWLLFDLVIVIQITLYYKWYRKIPGYLKEEHKHFIEERKRRKAQKKKKNKRRKKK